MTNGAKAILNVGVVGQATGLAMSMMPKKGKKFKPIKQGIKGIVGTTLLKEQANIIAGM